MHGHSFQRREAGLSIQLGRVMTQVQKKYFTARLTQNRPTGDKLRMHELNHDWATPQKSNAGSSCLLRYCIYSRQAKQAPQHLKTALSCARTRFPSCQHWDQWSTSRLCQLGHTQRRGRLATLAAEILRNVPIVSVHCCTSQLHLDLLDRCGEGFDVTIDDFGGAWGVG